VISVGEAGYVRRSEIRHLLPNHLPMLGHDGEPLIEPHYIPDGEGASVKLMLFGNLLICLLRLVPEESQCSIAGFGHFLRIKLSMQFKGLIPSIGL